MSQSKSIAAIAALFAVLAMGVAGSTAWAQDEERNSCVDTCNEAQERCIATCDVHDNPVECDEKCQETAEACTLQCR